jgi:hypothetical protein
MFVTFNPQKVTLKMCRYVYTYHLPPNHISRAYLLSFRQGLLLLQETADPYLYVSGSSHVYITHLLPFSMQLCLQLLLNLKYVYSLQKKRPP